MITQSLLSFRDYSSAAGDADATIIALHGYGGHLDQLVPLCRALRPSAEISVPEAPREVHPYTAYYTTEDLGSFWFSVLHDGSPDPTRFGDSLWRLEQFVVDVVRSRTQGRPVFLLGYEQGASLALTLAGVVPEYLDGVIGICGYAPRFRDWSMPLQDLGGLRILMVNDARDESIRPDWISNTVADLSERRGSVTSETVLGAKADFMNAVATVSDWFGTQMVASGRSSRSENAPLV